MVVPINSVSFNIPLVPWATHRHLTIICAQGVEYLNLVLRGWGISTRGVKSFEQNLSFTYLNIEVFMANSSLSWANGSKEKVYKV